MGYRFHIVDVFNAAFYGGNQLAVLTEAAGLSPEAMQKIAREFDFVETTFVLPKTDPSDIIARPGTPNSHAPGRQMSSSPLAPSIMAVSRTPA